MSANVDDSASDATFTDSTHSCASLTGVLAGEPGLAHDSSSPYMSLHLEYLVAVAMLRACGATVVLSNQIKSDIFDNTNKSKINKQMNMKNSQQHV